MSADIDPQFAPDHRPPENAPGAPDYQENIDVRGTHAMLSREKLDPANDQIPLPLWLVALCGVVLFLGGGYLFTYSGGFRADSYNAIAFGGAAPTAGAPGAGGAAASAAAPVAEDPVKLGERFFSANCISCHQASGTGLPGQYPPLAGSEWVQGGPHRLSAILIHGIQGPITVEGATFNGQMPAWGGTLNDKKIAYILTYIRQNWGNKGAPVTPDIVADERKQTASHDAPWSEAELKALPQ